MDQVRKLIIEEEEWRLLVDLIAGFDVTRYHPVRLDLAMQGLIRNGLVQEVRNATRVTKLGYRVRADEPRYVAGSPRVWYGVTEADAPPEKPGNHGNDATSA